MTELELMANKIPSQNTSPVKKKLREYAQSIQSNSVVVELGPWLGSTTAYIALGLNDYRKTNPIYVYERFCANEKEVTKAKAQGLKIREGKSTVSIFKKHLEPFGANIYIEKCDIINCIWPGMPIGLYVDDAAKQKEIFAHCMEQFSPSFIPRKTIVALLDYYYYEKTGKERHKAQRIFMERNNKRFQFLCRPDESSGAFFLFKG